MTTDTLTSQCWCAATFVDVPTEDVWALRTISCGAPWCRPGVITFTFPQPAPMMNMNLNLHWAEKAKRVKAWRHASFIAARTARINPQPRSIVGLILPVRSLKVRRDPHNFTYTTKCVIDGLVDARIWPDDTAEYVVTSEPAFRTGETVTIWIEALT